MAGFTVVQKHLNNYQALREKMSPELQEAFLNACLACELSEDDTIHAIMAFQAELFTASLDIQMTAIRTALDGALSARQAENKQLAKLLKDFQDSLKESAEQISDQASLVRSVSYGVIAWVISAAFALGMIATVAMQHFFTK